MAQQLRRAVGKHILIIDSHPDPAPGRLVHALADQYARAAEAGGHLVQVVKLCQLEFPWLRSAAEFAARPVGIIGSQQEHFRWADHLVIIYPLWFGSMPALLKAYLEQVLRPGLRFRLWQGQGPPEETTRGKVRAHRGHDEHAIPLLPALLPLTQRAIAGPEHSRVRRIQAGSSEPNRQRGWHRKQA